MIVKGLITDRSQRNVFRRNELSAKGWASMTAAERLEWLGNPLDANGVNLLPYGPNYSSVVEVKYRNSEIIATATSAGTYLYAISIIGEAGNYENKTFTLSVDSIKSSGGVPQLALYWHDDNGFEYAGASLSSAGSITVNTSEWQNTGDRGYLALYIYVTTTEEVAVGAEAHFSGVMFENGNTRHEYIPYTEILPTLTTRGAYNYSDLNRVERAVAEISDIVGFGLVTKTNWTMWDIPNSAEMERYLRNVTVIRDAFLINVELPTTMENLNYEFANNIEKVLLLAYAEITTG